MKPLIALALTLTACGPGADRTPRTKSLAEAPPNSRIDGGALSFSSGVALTFKNGGGVTVRTSKEHPLYSIEFDGGKWCDVYADAQGLHWKACPAKPDSPKGGKP